MLLLLICLYSTNSGHFPFCVPFLFIIFMIRCFQGGIKMNIKKYFNQKLCTMLFMIGLLAMLAPFYNANGNKVISGSLIISAYFPISLILIGVYLFSIWLMNKNPIFSTLTGIISIVSLLVLYIVQLNKWGGVSFLITFWFYFSFAFLVFALISIIVLSFKTFKKK